MSVSQAPPAPPTPLSPRALQREYVSGGSRIWGQMRRALPQYIDDLTADFGDDLYARMSYDAQVSACLSIVKASILEEGVTLAPAIDDKTADGYPRAVLIEEAAEAMLDDLTTPLDDVLWDMLSGMDFGSRVAEQVYELGPDPTGKTILTLTGLKVKPRRSTAFVVDQYMNVLGLLGDRPGTLSGPGPSTVVDPASIIPREKFAVFTFRAQDGDPRGTSVLRPAYTPWFRKMQVLQEWVAYLAQFAGPLLIGFTSETAVDGVDAAGQPATAEELMLGALIEAHNGTALVFGHGSIVEPLQVQGEGRVFLSAIEQCNGEIAKSLLLQTLATEEGEHQARAAASVHSDILDTVVRQGKNALLRMLSRDVLRNWVRYNWGDAALPLTPVPSLGTTERQDIPALMTAVAALERAKYLHVSQYPSTDQLLGLPVRDMSVPDDRPAPPPPADPTDPADQDAVDAEAEADRDPDAAEDAA